MTSVRLDAVVGQQACASPGQAAWEYKHARARQGPLESTTRAIARHPQGQPAAARACVWTHESEEQKLGDAQAGHSSRRDFG